MSQIQLRPPTQIQLRPYQWKQVLDLARHLVDGALNTALISPTGSGKSLVITVISAKTLGTVFKGVVLASPSRQVEAGFHQDYHITIRSASEPGTASRNEIEIDRDDFFFRPREDDGSRQEAVLDFLALEQPDTPVLLTTHMQLALLDRDKLPEDLSGWLLVLDEAHHAPRNGVTKIGRLAAEWRRRGGATLLVTATPFRADGQKVVPDDAKVHQRSIATHAISEYAPNDFQIQTVLLPGTRAESTKEFLGEELSVAENNAGSSPREMAQRWAADGKPKSIFISPSKRSRRWSKRLQKALEQECPSVRVVNAVGTEASVRDELLRVLESERGVSDYADSQVDVILACKRFDEGTDWPLASHVYNYGIPRSFGLVIQRWGRVFRCKAGIKGYPKEHREAAHITFFVPTVAQKVLAQFEEQHHDHAFLLACYMADWETARTFGSELRIRWEKHWDRRPPAKGEKDKVRDIRTRQAVVVSDQARLEVLALLAKWGGGFEKAAFRPPTLGEAQDYLDALADQLTEEQQQAGAALLAGQLSSEQLDEAGFDASLGSLKDPIRADCRKLFRSVVGSYRDQTFMLSGRAVIFYSEFTGQDADQVARRLRGQKPDLTVPMIEGAIRKCHAEHGKPPTSGSGDASAYFGFPESWGAVNQCLRKGVRGLLGGTTLPKLIAEMGLQTVKRDLRRHVIEGAIRKFHAEHGKPPSAGSGDASAYFGFPWNWNAVNAALSGGHRGLVKGFSLSKLALEMGLRQERVVLPKKEKESKGEEPDLTLPMIKEAVRKFHEEHGALPTTGSGDATAYFGFPVKWGAVNRALKIGSRGLPGGTSVYRLTWEVWGFRKKPVPAPRRKPPKPPCPDLTMPVIEGAIRKFHAEHGKPPTSGSGDASAYFGRPEKWGKIDTSLRGGSRGLPGGRSLSKLALEWGLRQIKPALTIPMIEEALHKAKGKPLFTNGGDASAYFGYPETWFAVDGCLRNGSRGLPGGSSIRQIRRLSKLSKPGLTVPMIEEAIRKFHAEHGRTPRGGDGDASVYFGHPESWRAVRAALSRGSRGLLGKSSLSKLSKPDLTMPVIEGAIRKFHAEHGKPPSASSGDATAYFGHPETWKRVDTSLRSGSRGLPGGSSLHRLLCEMSFSAAPGSKLACTCVEETPTTGVSLNDYAEQAHADHRSSPSRPKAEQAHADHRSSPSRPKAVQAQNRHKPTSQAGDGLGWEAPVHMEGSGRRPAQQVVTLGEFFLGV